jgi:hypothetical protein
MRVKIEQIDVPASKIVEYLLVIKAKRDKSKFLFSIGYSQENWEELLGDIVEIALNNELILQRITEFGSLYSAEGKLKNKKVITIWLQEINYDRLRFITLYPYNYEQKI